MATVQLSPFHPQKGSPGRLQRFQDQSLVAFPNCSRRSPRVAMLPGLRHPVGKPLWRLNETAQGVIHFLGHESNHPFKKISFFGRYWPPGQRSIFRKCFGLHSFGSLEWPCAKVQFFGSALAAPRFRSRKGSLAKVQFFGSDNGLNLGHHESPLLW